MNVFDRALANAGAIKGHICRGRAPADPALRFCTLGSLLFSEHWNAVIHVGRPIFGAVYDTLKMAVRDNNAEGRERVQNWVALDEEDEIENEDLRELSRQDAVEDSREQPCFHTLIENIQGFVERRSPGFSFPGDEAIVGSVFIGAPAPL